MTDQPHDDDALDSRQPVVPRRRVILSLIGVPLALAGLTACGGDDEDEDDEQEEQGDQEQEEDQEQGEDDD